MTSCAVSCSSPARTCSARPGIRASRKAADDAPVSAADSGSAAVAAARPLFADVLGPGGRSRAAHRRVQGAGPAREKGAVEKGDRLLQAWPRPIRGGELRPAGDGLVLSSSTARAACCAASLPTGRSSPARAGGAVHGHARSTRSAARRWPTWSPASDFVAMDRGYVGLGHVGRRRRYGRSARGMDRALGLKRYRSASTGSTASSSRASSCSGRVRTLKQRNA